MGRYFVGLEHTGKTTPDPHRWENKILMERSKTARWMKRGLRGENLNKRTISTRPLRGEGIKKGLKKTRGRTYNRKARGETQQVENAQIKREEAPQLKSLRSKQGGRDKKKQGKQPKIRKGIQALGARENRGGGGSVPRELEKRRSDMEWNARPTLELQKRGKRGYGSAGDQVVSGGPAQSARRHERTNGVITHFQERRTGKTRGPEKGRVARVSSLTNTWVRQSRAEEKKKKDRWLSDSFRHTNL